MIFTEFKAPVKYVITYLIAGTLLLIAACFQSYDNVMNFITHIENVVNTDSLLSMTYLLKQVGFVVLWFVIAEGVHIIIALMLMATANSKNRI